MPADEITVRLAGLRVAAGVSRAAMARRLRVDRKTVMAWELGRNRMPLSMARAYAREVSAELVLRVDERGWCGMRLSAGCWSEDT